MVADQVHATRGFGLQDLATAAEAFLKMRYSYLLQTSKSTMDAWYYFWLFDFTVAGLSFVVILLLVAVRGFDDLLTMFRLLDEEANSSKNTN